MDTSASSAGALGGDGGIDDSIVTDDGEGGADGSPGAGTSDGPSTDVATASATEDGQGAWMRGCVCSCWVCKAVARRTPEREYYPFNSFPTTGNATAGFGASGTAAGSDDGSDADMAEAVRDLDREVRTGSGVDPGWMTNAVAFVVDVPEIIMGGCAGDHHGLSLTSHPPT